MGTVTQTIDPTSSLSSIGPSGSAAAAMDNLRGQCGIFGAVDQVVSWLTGFSPLQEWVFKPLTGDWNALDMGSAAWSAAAQAVSDIADNLDSFPQQVGNGWEGDAERAWETRNSDLSGKIRQVSGQCDNLATMCDALSQAGQGLAELIAGLLSFIGEMIAELLPQLAIPIEGEIAAGVYATRVGIEVTEGSAKAIRFFEKFSRLVEKIMDIVNKIQTVLAVIQQIVEILQNVKTAQDSGHRAEQNPFEPTDSSTRRGHQDVSRPWQPAQPSQDGSPGGLNVNVSPSFTFNNNHNHNNTNHYNTNHYNDGGHNKPTYKWKTLNAGGGKSGQFRISKKP